MPTGFKSSSRAFGSNTECFPLNISSPKNIKGSKPQAENSVRIFAGRSVNSNTSEH